MFDKSIFYWFLSFLFLVLPPFLWPLLRAFFSPEPPRGSRKKGYFSDPLWRYQGVGGTGIVGAKGDHGKQLILKGN